VFGDSSQEALISTPNGTTFADSQRIVINPGAGAANTTGEGGDIYLYAGRGGDAGGTGGDIKIRGGLGPVDGAGGYLDIMGGEAAGNGVGGRIDIQGGESGNSNGGDINITGGQGINGGDVNIQSGNGTAGPGGDLTLQGGISSNGLAAYGNVNIAAGASTWRFDNAGNLTLPANTFAVNYANGTPVNISGGGGNATLPLANGTSNFDIATANGNATITANAASTWTFGTDGNLNLPGATAGETIATQSGYITVGNLLIGQGGALFNSNNDSWALYGNLSDPGTVIFIPSDADAGNGLPLYIESQQSNVEIRSGSSTWNFGNTSNLTLPQGGIVYETNIPFGSLSGNTIALKPQGGIDADQQLLIYPTVIPGTDDNHLHLTTGNLYNTELFLGNDNLYVKLANTGNVVVNSNDDTGNSAQWTFGTQGNLTVPANTWFNTPPGSSGNINFHPDDGASVNIKTGANGAALIIQGDVFNTPNRIEIETFGDSNSIGGTLTGRFHRGNLSNPQAVQNGDQLLAIKGKGYDGSSFTNPSGQITIDAVDNWSANNHATHISFWTTPINSNVIQESARLSANGTMSVSGNIVGSNVSTTGNVTGTYFIGDGSQLTGLPATYGNANVANYLPTFSGNISAGNVSTTGNVIAGNILVVGSISPSGVASPAPTLSGFSSVSALTLSASGNVIATGNITGGNLVTAGLAGNITMTGGNILGANVVTANIFSATGNITGNYFVGNIQGTIGSILNIDSTNLTVTNILAPSPGNAVNIGAGGNNNLVVSNVLVQVQNVPLSVAGNVTVGGNLNVTGNVITPNLPAFRVYGNGNTINLDTSVNSTGNLTINNYAVDYNQGGYLDTATGTFTAPVAGLYAVDLVARSSNFNNVLSQISVFKNGSTQQCFWEVSANTTVGHMGVSSISKLAVGDTLTLKVVAGYINFDSNDNWSVAFLG
jgi:hypothetical protein